MELTQAHMYGSSKTSLRRLRIFLRPALALLLMTLVGTSAFGVSGQQVHPSQQNGITVRGRVFNSEGKPVHDASVRLKPEDSPLPIETKTDAVGAFVFDALRSGQYYVDAESAGLKSHGSSVFTLSAGDQKDIDLTLEAPRNTQASKEASSPSASDMEFSDVPQFTIAGVTDWTAIGGHGSDATLRTSEDLARETLTLKPQDLTSGASMSGGPREAGQSEASLRDALARAPRSYEANHELGEFYLHAGRYQDAIPRLKASSAIDPGHDDNAYDLALAYKGAGELLQARDYVQDLLVRKDTVDLQRLAAEIDEQLGDPFAAVKEYEHSVRLDPSEQNYFAWGSELLLHRAVWQAVEVFREGQKLYPKSSRMLTALGTALFAGAVYDEAAQRLCDASDLNPANPEPYLFMGKIEMATPAPFPCVNQKLARFAHEQPQNALANYLYAMSLLKEQKLLANPGDSQRAESLLERAVMIDPKCVDAFLQLGIMYSSRGENGKAISFYTKAIEEDPQLGEAHYRLGMAYDRTGESAKAKKEFLLHDEIEKRQAAAVEDQRREIKQFVVAPQVQVVPPAAQ